VTTTQAQTTQAQTGQAPVTTKRALCEAGRIVIDSATSKYRVCLISEGRGSSGFYGPEFFTQANADALAGALSFPGHPEREWRPDLRDPLSAIAYIGESVTVERDPETGLLGFWSDYKVADAKPEVKAYLVEFGAKLGLSIFIEGFGYESPVTGEWIVTELWADDPYKAVDLVVAAGRGGKISRALEALSPSSGSGNQTSVKVAEEREDLLMDEDVKAEFTALRAAIESLSNALSAKAQAEAQAEADEKAVQAAVEARLGDFDKAITLISESGLTESQVTELRAAALAGEDVAPRVEGAKRIVAEAKAIAEASGSTVAHRGGGNTQDFDASALVPGFGKVG